MTIPTIAELKGNTILELLHNCYNTLKNAIFKKQNKLIAGDNIIINEDTNRISAIVGGTPVLEDYYTKTEVDGIASELGEEIDTKADVTDVYEKNETYNKTEVDNLLSPKANSSDVYSKTEVNNLVSPKANSSDVYNKTEVDNLLSPKANSADVYTKIEVNNLVSPKANSEDVYSKSETYSKTEIDNSVVKLTGYQVIDGEKTFKKTVNLFSQTGDNKSFSLFKTSDSNYDIGNLLVHGTHGDGNNYASLRIAFNKNNGGASLFLIKVVNGVTTQVTVATT